MENSTEFKLSMYRLELAIIKDAVRSLKSFCEGNEKCRDKMTGIECPFINQYDPDLCELMTSPCFYDDERIEKQIEKCREVSNNAKNN